MFQLIGVVIGAVVALALQAAIFLGVVYGVLVLLRSFAIL